MYLLKKIDALNSEGKNNSEFWFIYQYCCYFYLRGFHSQYFVVK